MKHTIWGFLLLTTCLQGATVTWDDEATQVIDNKTEPDTRWSIKENWSGDELPGPGDDVILLIHGSPDPVLLSSSTTVSTIESKVPFQINDTLTITSSGFFEHSIVLTINGTIRANGPVSFQGINDLRSTTLTGPATFTNDGDATFGSKGITVGTEFINNNHTFLTTGKTRLGNFENKGTFDISNATVETGTEFINTGTVIKKTSEVESQFLGNFSQTAGQITVEEEATLLLAGPVQEFEGGAIVADGILNLTQIPGGFPSRTFDGLTGISGQGTVNQLREFELLKDLTVNMSEAPGYDIWDLVFGRLDPSPAGTKFTNSGYLTINGTPEFISVDPEDPSSSSNLFVNSGTVMQGVSSNPLFGVRVENSSNWTTYGMRVSQFENSATLYLEGDSHEIAPANISKGGILQNNHHVLLGNNGIATHTISTKFNQPKDATTTLNNGLLTLEGGSDSFKGTFDFKSNSRLNITHGTYANGEQNGPVEEDKLVLTGQGTATIGGSQLNPTIQSGRIDNLIGNSETGSTNSFRMRSGTLSTFLLQNEGYMEWSGGTIGNPGLLNNIGHLDIAPGPPRILKGQLRNGHPALSTLPKIQIIQTSSLTLAPMEGENSGGSIENWNTHRLHSGASISGGGPNAYQNHGLFICENQASAAISCEFENIGNFFDAEPGTVRVTSDSVLGLTNCKNISSLGNLRGGRWVVEEGGQIIFEFPLQVIDEDCDWTGPGATTVRSIAKNAKLTKTTSEVHSVALEVAGVVSLGAGTTTTIPEVNLEEDAYLRGSGELIAALNVGSGNLAPAESPGTLTITGDTTFTEDSTYEWEASANDNADLLQINSGTATLAGTVRPMLIDGFFPSGQTTFTILNAPTIVGTFDQVDDTALPAGMTATLGYTSTSVTITLDWTIELTNYDEWKSANFTAEEQMDDLISGPGADPDKDGLSNLQEYVYGTSPKSANEVPVKLSDATDEYIELTFPWADGISDAYFQVEIGNDLEAFLPTEHTVISSDSTVGLSQYIIRIDISNLGMRSFVRLRTLQIEL